MLTRLEVIEMDVASHLNMTVFEMKSKMTEEEFYNWQEYLQLHPKHSTDIQIAQLTTLAAGFMGLKGAKFEDFFIHKDPEPPKPMKSAKETEPEERVVGLELDMFVRGVYK